MAARTGLSAGGGVKGAPQAMRNVNMKKKLWALCALDFIFYDTTEQRG